MIEIPRFYPVLDTTALANRQFQPVDAAGALLEAGVRILQYRHKDAWTQRHLDEARQIARLCAQARALFVMNDRADFAHILGAALHIGQDDLPPVAVRKVVSAETVIGFSTHDRHQILRGETEPVQYLSLGPIFATTSKDKPDPVVGIDHLKRLRALSSKPLVAIGGITLENAPQVLAAGASSVAVISGLLTADSDRDALRRRAEEWLRNTNI